MNTSSAIDDRNSSRESSLSSCFSSTETSPSKSGDPTTSGKSFTSLATMERVSEKEETHDRIASKHAMPSKCVSTHGMLSLP